MSDTHFISLKASDKGGSRGAGRISAVPRNTCQHLSQDGLHIHAPSSQELHGGTYKIKNIKWNPRVIIKDIAEQVTWYWWKMYL